MRLFADGMTYTDIAVECKVPSWRIPAATGNFLSSVGDESRRSGYAQGLKGRARLQQLRKERKISAERMASTLGVSLNTYRLCENRNILKVDASLLKAIAKFFDVSAGYIMGDKDEPGKYDGN